MDLSEWIADLASTLPHDSQIWFCSLKWVPLAACTQLRAEKKERKKKNLPFPLISNSVEVWAEDSRNLVPVPAKKKSRAGIAAEFSFCVQLRATWIEHFLCLASAGEGCPSQHWLPVIPVQVTSLIIIISWLGWIKHIWNSGQDLAHYPSKHPEPKCLAHHLEAELQAGDILHQGHGMCNILGLQPQTETYSFLYSLCLATEGIIVCSSLLEVKVNVEKN